MKRLIYVVCLGVLVLVGVPVPAYAEESPEVVVGDEVKEEAPPPAILSAINPGYTTADGVKNSNDFVELARVAGEPFSLAGVSVRYNGKFIYEFADDAWFEGDSILLRYAASPEADEADDVYSVNISMSKGLVELVFISDETEEVWSAVCWGGEGCYDHFDKAATRAKTLWQSDDGWIFSSDYAPAWGGLIFIELPEEPTVEAGGGCVNLKLNEILTYWASAQSEQFVELYNSGEETVLLDGCELVYKNKVFPLSGAVAPGGYFVFQNPELTLTKDPSKENEIALRTVEGVVVARLVYPHGQKKLTSYAYFGDEGGEAVWLRTYEPTPGAANVFQEFKSCEEGKVINISTGNCVKVPVVAAVVPCKANQYRNPETGRCKKIESGPTPCPEGYERNPETNRCRMIRVNNGAEYAPISGQFTDRKIFIGLGAVITVAVLGGGYVVFQFRHELFRLGRRLFGRKEAVSGRIEE